MKLPTNPTATWAGNDFAGSFWQSWLFEIWQFITQGFGASASSQSLGTASMTAGSVVVSSTAIRTNSIVLLTYVGTPTTPGFLSYGSITNGTSFTIHSSASTTATIGYVIVNQF